MGIAPPGAGCAGIGMLPIWEWSMGMVIGCGAEGVAPCSIGLVMPFVGFAAGFFTADFFAGTAFFARAAFFFAAAVFLAGAFFFAAGFAGIGMVMPGMFIDCAAAGMDTIADASAVAAARKISFTCMTPKRRRRR